MYKYLIRSSVALISLCSFIASTNTTQPEGGVRVLPQQAEGSGRALLQQRRGGLRPLPQPQSQGGISELPQPQLQDSGRVLTPSNSATGSILPQSGQKPPPRPLRSPLSSGIPLKSPSKENLPGVSQDTKPSSVHALSTSQPSCRKKSTKSPYTILSMNGASVRGIAQFAILQALERKVNEKLRLLEKSKLSTSGKGDFKLPQESITTMFDLFAGTSAGSINVGAILVPEDPLTANTAGNIPTPKFNLQVLETKVPEMINVAFSDPIARQVRTLGGLAGSKFSAKPLEKYLQEYSTGTTPQSKDVQARMSDLVKPAIITSYDVSNREIMNFSTFEACRVKNSQTSCSKSKADDEGIFLEPKDANGYEWNQMNVKVWEAMRASSAAPTYFKALGKILKGKSRALIDAGLFVMSPALLAWVEAQRFYPDRPIVIVSIASGTINEARDYETKGATAGSIPKVLKPTIETCVEGQPALTHLMMQQLPNVSYFSINFEVENTEFDDVSEKNIKALLAAAAKAEESESFKGAVDAIVDARLQRIENLKKDPNDFKPFICEAKEKQKHTISGGVPDHSKILKDISTAQQGGATLSHPLQEQLKQLHLQCQLLKSGPDYTQLQCPDIESKFDHMCKGIKDTQQRTQLRCPMGG